MRMIKRRSLVPQSFAALLVFAIQGCPSADEGPSDTSTASDSQGADDSADDTGPSDIAADEEVEAADQEDGAEVQATVPIAPTEGFVTDPTADNAVYDVDIVVLGSGVSITGAAVVVGGNSYTRNADTGSVTLTGLPVKSMTHGMAFADGHVPRAFVVTYSRAQAESLEGRRTFTVVLDPVEAEVTLQPNEAVDVAVGKSHLVVPAGSYTSTSALTLRASDVDLVDAASGPAATVAQRVMKRMPSTTGAVAMVDGERARVPAVAARLDVDVRDAAGIEQSLAANAELKYNLAIPPLLQPAFTLGSVEPLYHYDAASNRYEKVGSCVVSGATCIGKASTAGAVLLFPDDALLYAFGCARAKVLVSRETTVSLTERDLYIHAFVEDSLDPIVPETQYAIADGYLELTSVFPYVSRSLAMDQPKFQVVSRGRTTPISTSYVVSPSQRGVMLRGGDVDIFKACREVPAIEVAINHGPPPGPLEPTGGTDVDVEDAKAPPSNWTCSPEIADRWATIGPDAPPCPDSQLICLTPDTSAPLALAGWSHVVTVSCGAGCQASASLAASSGPTATIQTPNGGSYPPPSDSFSIEVDSGDAAAATIDFGIDFGGSASELGAGWRFALVLLGGSQTYDAATDSLSPWTSIVQSSVPLEPYGIVTLEGGEPVPPNWTFVTPNTIEYTGTYLDDVGFNAAIAPVALLPPEATSITFVQPNWVASESRDFHVTIALVRVPVCEEVAQ